LCSYSYESPLIAGVLVREKASAIVDSRLAESAWPTHAHTPLARSIVRSGDGTLNKNTKTDFKMLTNETSEDIHKCQGNPSESGEISSGKIIDFFAAREALESEARSIDEQTGLQQQIDSATHRKKRIHLSDPWEDVMLLTLLVAAIVLGLLVISGFG
jgi:hypothetical protein